MSQIEQVATGLDYAEAFYRRAPLATRLGAERGDADYNRFDELAAKLRAGHVFSRGVIDGITRQVDEGALTPGLGALELLFIESEE